MKYTKSLLLIAFLAACQMASAQLNHPSMGGFQLQSVRSNVGVHLDHFSAMSFSFMEGRVSDNTYQKISLDGMTRADYISSTEGANINLSAQFVRNSTSSTPFSRFEAIETSIGLHFGREIMIDYYSNTTPRSVEDQNFEMPYFGSNLTYCDLQNEINLGATYKRGISWYNTLSIYTGLGMNAGTTLASKLMIFGSLETDPENPEPEYLGVDESYNLSETLTGRLFVPIGAELLIKKKLHLTAETRIGMGYNYAIGGEGFRHMNFSALLGFGWSI